MKTTKEMIEVMQAYVRGEQIQLLNRLGVWVDIDMPEWSWGLQDYRVKPKKKYVPFDTAEEFFAAQRKHGYRLIGIDDGIITDDISPKAHDISITLDGHVFLHIEGNWNNDCSYLGDLEDLFEDYKFIDGTPCGKEVDVCQH